MRERLVELTFLCCGCLSIVTTVGIVLVLAFEAFSFFEEVSIVDFFTDSQWTPLFSDKHFGIAPLLVGTLLTSGIALVVALPFGLLIAIYLTEFASPRLRSILKPMLEILAGIPTVVFGYFALVFVTPILQMLIPSLEPFNALSPGLVMGLMILPMVASLSEDALYTVPRSLRDAAYALGATRLQMVFSVLVPAAMGGVTASFILAMSRAIGETMIVAIAAGQQPVLTGNPLSPVETMTAFIVQVSLGDTPHGTLEYKTIFAVAAALFLMTLFLNNISLRIRERFERAYV
ncbi:MAG: phosphate ABC transporter permease subunit PstC [Oligoflexia bacterium]|nr:phosphate ABC transporter permease subunit PstC [Oligoflexia bacterium]